MPNLTRTFAKVMPSPIGAVTSLLLCWLIIARAAASEPSSPLDTSDLAVVSANYLATEYDKNEVAADARFKGQRLIIVGKVEAIKKGIVSGAYIVLKGKGVLLRDVQCDFGNNAEAELAKLVPGQPVAVAGKIDGLFGNVNVKDCSLVTSYKAKGATKRDDVHRFHMVDGRYLSNDELSNENAFNNAFPMEVRLKHQLEDSAAQVARLRQEAEAAAKARRAKAEEDAKKAKAEDEAKYRTWTSASGSFTTNAKLLSYASGTVTIQTRASKKISVSLDKLSQADQDFVAKWRKQKQQGKATVKTDDDQPF